MMVLNNLSNGIKSFMKTNSSRRIYFLDALRSFLIVGVVLLHATQIYNPAKTWLIFSDNTTIVASYMILVLGWLLMPTFFMIAGYSSVISLNNHSNKSFFWKRISRLLIPLLTVVLIFNTIQALILVKFGWKEYTIASYINNGDWIQHVWFLINLIVYTIISILTLKYFKEKVKHGIDFIIKQIESISIYKLFLFMPLISIILLILYRIVPDRLLGINLTQIIGYMPFYFFGILLFLDNKLLKKITNTSIVIDIFVLLLSAVIIKYVENFHDIEYRLIYYYFKYLGIWFISSLAFTIFYKYFNFQSKLIFQISDASYSIYLIHHILVIIFGLFVIYLNVDFYIGILIVFTFSTFLSYILHKKLILSHKLFQLFINGKFK